MTDEEVRASLSKVLVSDRSIGIGPANELVDRYLSWRRQIDGRAVEEWEDRNARKYIDRRWLFEGRPTVVFAGQGKGKSNFATWVIEKVLETRPDWDVYTNVPFPWDEDGGGPPEAKPCDRLHAISRLSEVLRGAAGSVRAGRKPAVIIDEMDQAVTSHDWSSEAAQSWQRLVNIERHLRIRGPLLVYHAYRHIPVVLREGTMLKAMLQVIIKDGQHWEICREEQEDGFLHIPRSVLPYLTYGLRGFDIDVEVQDLEKHLSGSLESVARQLTDYLDAAKTAATRKARWKAELDRPPVCERCGQSFTRHDNLTRHRRTAHGPGA